MSHDDMCREETRVWTFIEGQQESTCLQCLSIRAIREDTLAKARDRVLTLIPTLTVTASRPRRRDSYVSRGSVLGVLLGDSS